MFKRGHQHTIIKLVVESADSNPEQAYSTADSTVNIGKQGNKGREDRRQGEGER